MESSSGFSEDSLSGTENVNFVQLNETLVSENEHRQESTTDAAATAAEGPPNAERRRREKRRNINELSAIFPPVAFTMLIAVISARTWMWDSLKRSDSGMFSAKSLGGGGAGDDEETSTEETIKVDGTKCR